MDYSIGCRPRRRSDSSTEDGCFRDEVTGDRGMRQPAQTPADAGDPNSTTAQADHPRRVLLVDDDEGLRSQCAAGLAGVGFDVQEAGDGEVAWRVLLRDHYDLLITDHIMPKASGAALVRRMRIAHMPLRAILISEAPADERATLDPWSKIDGFVQKPFLLRDLLLQVEAVLPPSDRD